MVGTVAELYQLITELKEGGTPDLSIDYGYLVVNSVRDNSFSKGFEENTDALEAVYNDSRFRNRFPWLMEDWLADGELFLQLARDEEGILRITDLRAYKVDEVEAQESGRITFLRILFQQEDDLWFRKEYTPDEIITFLPSRDRDLGSFTVNERLPNELGEVPFAYFKWGNEKRGEPITKPVQFIIESIDKVFKDIREWNHQNAHPVPVLEGVNDDVVIVREPGKALTLPIGGSLKFIGPPDTIKNSFDELEELIDGLQDMTGILILTDVSAQTSGEAIMRRQTRLDNVSNLARTEASEELDRLNQLIAKADGISVEPVRFPPIRTPSESEVKVKLENWTTLKSEGVISPAEYRTILRQYLGLDN